MHFLKHLFQGRINRRTFLLHTVLYLILFWLFKNYLLSMPVLRTFYQVSSTFTKSIFNNSRPGTIFYMNPYFYILILLLILILPLIILIFSAATKRLHDIGRSGWFALFLYFPVINLLLIALLVIVKGDQKINKYGPTKKDRQIP